MQLKNSVLIITLTLVNGAIAETMQAPTGTIKTEADVPRASLSKQSDLHAEHCAGCHINITDGDGSVIYTRSDRLAKNETELLAWVKHFADGLKLNWTDAEISYMRDYIKNTYYQDGQQ